MKCFVSYLWLYNYIDQVEGIGGDILLIIPSSDFTTGPSTIKVFAFSPGCGSLFLTNQINVTKGPLADTSYIVSVINPSVCQGEDRQITLGGNQNGFCPNGT